MDPANVTQVSPTTAVSARSVHQVPSGVPPPANASSSADKTPYTPRRQAHVFATQDLGS
jgi:hypothetical protein